MSHNHNTPAAEHLSERLIPRISLTMPYAWHQRLLKRFIEDPESMALARLGLSRGTDASSEYLVRELLPDRSALAGAPQWQRFAAFTRSDGSGLTPYVESNLSALPPAVVIEVLHGTGAFRGKAWGFARGEAGRIVPLEELVLPGPEMRRIPLLSSGTMLAPVNDERLSRTSGGLGAEGPLVLARMRDRPMAIFGASRNGLFLAEWAIRLGIPILLCDAKPLKRSHLGEISLLLGEEDVGRPKVEAFARRAGEWSIATAAVEPIVARADSPAGAAASKRASLLIDACDTDAGRLAVAMLATVYHKPQLSVASGISFDAQGRRTMGADIRLVLAGDRCLLELGGIVDYSRALRELAAGPPPARDEDWRTERAGSLRSLNQAATAVGIRLVEDLFTGRVRNSRWVRIEWTDDGRFTTREPEPGPRQTDCPLCRKAGEGDAALGLE